MSRVLQGLNTMQHFRETPGDRIQFCIKFANDTKLGRARLELKQILPNWKYIMETK